MNKKLEEFQVDYAELLFDVKFPEIYREILLDSKWLTLNTCWSVFPEFQPEENDQQPDEPVSDARLSIVSVLSDYLNQLYHDAVSWRRFPANALPIAGDGCGDVLVLLPSGISSGGERMYDEAFYIYDHSDGEIYLFAESIEELASDFNDEI